MNKYSRLWVWVVLFLAAAGQNGSAQNQAGEDNVFDAIKSQVISAAGQNKELAAENNALKARLISLQLEVERYKQEAGEPEQKYAADGDPLRGQGGAGAEDDPLIREAQAIYLSGQSMDIDDRQRLWELYLYDLQYQKQERQLDFELKESLSQRVEEERRQALDALQEDVRKNTEKEKALSLKIAELEKAALVYPQEIELLKMENEALKRRIHELKRFLPRQD